ncbi:hypothetical protein Q765_10045 [Flavobacterium rivuli WB 3.3-2 = DSM 21788]|uniref:Uncharacterized protein n=1 Tax=Flavobacterium rivuli WB 3.3-2 = DSM 21788 TaxID=1121895 RepID=A0A0A2M2S0_9FLAO|nr:hypothetical protein [Flavobacterium rivuli]KGO86559.1 hypothetical protein Q765_10045 [Flavobacterium rivuli WB 3.3-2 = DSM 21788]
MIQKITFIAFTLLLSFFTNAQEKTCSKFKEGTFKVTDPTSKKICYITRKGNVQTEKMENAEEVYDFDIVWIDDCTYTVSPTPATAARIKDINKAGTMTVMITRAKDSSYVQRIKIANKPKFRREDKVYLVKNEENKG